MAMESATTILSLLLAFICVASALMDFRRHPSILESMARIQSPYPPELLGRIKAAAAGGLIIGVWLEWLGSITAICLAGYFFIAVAYHRKAKDSIKDTAPAAFLLIVSLATFVISIIAK